MADVTVLHGDCLDLVRMWPDNTFDAVVTDPPYALVSIVNRFGKPGSAPAQFGADGAYARASAGFMGKAWDTGETAFAVEFWAEILRVLKPGGHVLAFSGSRTYHRLACAIEDAGFEIRDQIMWLYGSGFPKSHDVSKGIDKQDAADLRRARQLQFTEWVRSTGLTAARIDALTGASMGGHYTTEASQPAVATREFFEVLRPHFGCVVPGWVEQMVDERTVESENFKAREVVGQTTKARSTSGNSALPTGGGETVYRTWDETAAHTEAARHWQGWGTALKPAHEPIVMARKPLIGAVAANVLAHGTGALNIDGCRVATDDDEQNMMRARSGGIMGAEIQNGVYGRGFTRAPAGHAEGRWPANVIHDGSDEVVAGFPYSKSSGGKDTNGHDGEMRMGRTSGQGSNAGGLGDSGSAARFFYCAKASKKDRGEGNTHPTVKPQELMRYLCRMVTPPGGLVLDPFAGSGSTGLAARAEGFNAVLMEREDEYVEIINRRLTAP